MAYLKLLGQVRERLTQLGVTHQIENGTTLTERQIRAASKALPIEIPQSLLEFYREVGDGLFVEWRSSEEIDDEECVFASFVIQSLDEMIEMYEGDVEHGQHFDDNYDYPHVQDRRLARKTAARMRKWLALIEEGNGDSISLDAGAPGHPVVLCEHDWFDGGSGENGKLLSSNLREFFKGWASVCFQCPKSLFWLDALCKHGVDWNSPEFREPYKLVR